MGEQRHKFTTHPSGGKAGDLYGSGIVEKSVWVLCAAHRMTKSCKIAGIFAHEEPDGGGIIYTKLSRVSEIQSPSTNLHV